MMFLIIECQDWQRFRLVLVKDALHESVSCLRPLVHDGVVAVALAGLLQPPVWDRTGRTINSVGGTLAKVAYMVDQRIKMNQNLA